MLVFFFKTCRVRRVGVQLFYLLSEWLLEE